MKKIVNLFLVLIFVIFMVCCGHTHEYQEEVIEPTCTEKGYTIYTCECGDTYQGNEKVSKGHTYQEEIIEHSCKEGYYCIT